MPQIVGNYGLPPWEEVLKGASCKYAKPAFAHKQATPWVSALIQHLSDGLPGIHAHTIVDVKIWPFLEADTAPALIGWHFDCVRSGDDPHRPEHHALYQAGAGCYTTFEEFQPTDGDIVHYGRDLHTATLATRSGPRLLVRVTQCDQIRGSNRPFTPTQKRVSS